MKNARLAVLKELFLDYKTSPSLDTFEKILKRVDEFILYVVKDLKRSRYYLKTIDTGEMYQTGIIGIYKAIDTFEVADDCIMIPARMKICIRKSILDAYKCYKKELIVEDPHGIAIEPLLSTEFSQFEGSVYLNEDCDLVVKHINKLVVDGKLTKEDLVVIKERIMLKKPLRIVAHMLHVSHQTVVNRTEKIQSIIHHSIIQGK